MGTWGTAIFSDDTASDVRGDFRDLIGDGLSPVDATERLMTKYASSVDDPDDGPPFWLGLAVTQWKCGRLQESVKDRALQIIDSGADLQRWSENPRLARTRQAVLDKTRAQLLSPSPPAKRIAKRFVEANDWEIGELIAYRMSSGKHLVFQVFGHYTDRHGRTPKVDLLDYYDDAVPTLEQARNLRVRIFIDKDHLYHPYRHFSFYAMAERQVPRKRLTRLGMHGSAPDVRKDLTAVVGLNWPSVDLYFTKRLDRPLTLHAGPGGDDHQTWEVGDVLAYRTLSSAYILLHLVGRHQGHGVDGAPILIHLAWQDTSLPEAATLGSLIPDRGRWPTVPPSGFVLVHDDDDGVDGSALSRIGNFTPTYEFHRHRRMDFFASLPMIVRSIERERSRAIG